MKDFFKKIIIWFVVLILSFIFANLFGKLYSYSLSLGGGFSGFIIPNFWGDFVDGVSRSYLFFLIFLFTIFGGSKKYWWIGILLIPAALFELYFDSAHLYFPIALGLLAWLLGFAAFKLLARREDIA